MAVKFIKILFIFLLPLVIAYTCTEYLLSAAENIYTVKKRMLEQEKDSLQVLIAGTSQTFHSLNPALFNRPSLNLAAPTQPLYYDCQIILKHLSQLKKLRLVIIPIDYITLFSDANKNSYYLLNYYHFWNIDNPVLSKTDVRRYSLLAYFKPATCREMIAEMITEKKINIRMEDKEMLDNGFEPLDAPADTSRFDESAAKLMGNWNATQLSKNYFDGNTKRLNELINTLQEKKIKVLLFTTPVTQYIYKRHDSIFMAMRSDFLKSIVSRFSNVTYADFSLDQRFSIKDFYDPDHLDAAGAAKFSNIIRYEYIDQMIH